MSITFKIGLIIGFLLFSGVWFFITHVIWLEQAVLVDERVEQPPLNGLVKSDFHFMFGPEYRSNLLKNVEQEPISDSFSDYLKISQQYSAQRPLEPMGWYWQSLFSKNIDADYSNTALTTATVLSQNKIRWLKNYFAERVTREEYDQAMLIAKQISLARPEEFDKYFYFLSRLLGEDRPQDLVDFVSNLTVESNYKEEDDSYFFQRALQIAVEMKNVRLAGYLWHSSPVSIKRISNYGFGYLNYLAQNQDWEGVKKVVFDKTGEVLSLGQISNPGFDDELGVHSHCWRVKSSKGVKVKIKEFGLDRKLSVNFDGEKNLWYGGVECFVGVSGRHSYQLTGDWSGKEISTFSGPYVEIVEATRNRRLARGESRYGSWKNSKFLISFRVPEGVNIVRVRIRRDKTDLLDSKIKGEVWFDNFVLRSIENKD